MALDAMGEPCEDLAAAKQFLTYIYILEGFRSSGDAFFDALKATVCVVAPQGPLHSCS